MKWTHGGFFLTLCQSQFNESEWKVTNTCSHAWIRQDFQWGICHLTLSWHQITKPCNPNCPMHNVPTITWITLSKGIRQIKDKGANRVTRNQSKHEKIPLYQMLEHAFPTWTRSHSINTVTITFTRSPWLGLRSIHLQEWYRSMGMNLCPYTVGVKSLHTPWKISFKSEFHQSNLFKQIWSTSHRLVRDVCFIHQRDGLIRVSYLRFMKHYLKYSLMDLAQKITYT